MAKLSNIIITALNLLTTVLALAAIGAFLFLHFLHPGPTRCQRAIEGPVLAAGLILLGISLLGLFGSGLRVAGLLWAYLAALGLVIVGWLAFSGFVLAATRGRAGEYSHWLRRSVVEGGRWEGIRSCLVDANVCMQGVSSRESLFLRDKLTPIQSGCCKPPTPCGFKPKYATYWEVSREGPTTTGSPDPDCKVWSNDPKKLCYDCNSCKAGVLASLRKEWRTFAITNAVILVVLFVIYMVACCAVHNSRRHHSSPKLTRSAGGRSNWP